MSVYDQQVRVITGTMKADISVTTATGTAVTYTTGSTHFFNVGDEVLIKGLATAGHNGIFTITAVPTSLTFRVASTQTGTGNTAGLAILNRQYDLTVIDSVSVRGGRQDVTANVTPMTATVDIVQDYYSDADLTDFDLNHGLIIQTYDTFTTKWVDLFVGQVTDVTARIDASSNSGFVPVVFSIQGTTPMARLDYNSSSYSGSDALVTTGNAGYLWVVETLNKNPDFGSGFYWYGAVGVDNILMHKRVNGTYVDSDVIYSAASSCRANFHDRPDGKIYYSTFASTVTPTYFSLSEELFTINSLSATKSIRDVYNKTNVTTTNVAVSTGTAADTTSRNKYGRRAGDRDTELAVQASIDLQATDFLAIRKNPKFRMDAVQINLANTNLDDEMRSALYKTRTNTPYEINFGTLFGTDQYFVDNWGWSFSRGNSTIAFQVCEYADLHP